MAEIYIIGLILGFLLGACVASLVWNEIRLNDVIKNLERLGGE